MVILDGTKEIEYNGQTAIVIGKFDGVHAGHKRLIRETVNREDGLKSLVFTFTFSSDFFNNNRDRIFSPEVRREKFEALGVDYLVEYELNHENASMEPETFAREILKKRLHCGVLVCGNDLSFGNKGRGNVALLKSMEQELGIKVIVIDKVTYKGDAISSTRIRQAINDGEIKDADLMLGDECTNM